MSGVETELCSGEPNAAGDDIDLQILHVRSSSMMAGYLGPDGIDRTAVNDGWFATGDVSQIDEAGNIYLRGRITEVINVAGMKVVPSEVEEVIMSLPQVQEAKVYAGNSPAGMQFVKAAVVADGAVESTDIRAHCAAQLIYYKRPSMVLMVDALPKSPSGKVVFAELP